MPTVIDLTNLGAAGFVIRGEADYDLAGYSVSDAGDVNGDGFDDVIVGAIGGDYGGDTSGEAYVVFGKPGGFGPIDLGNLAPGDGFGIGGASSFDEAGWSVSSVGDVNGDGFDDLIVGAQHLDHVGAAYVLFGKGSGFGTIDLGNLAAADGFAILGDRIGDRLGFSVSGAGDVNGDGFDDVIVGTPYENDEEGGQRGQAYVIFGKASGLATLNVRTLDPTDPAYDPAVGFVISADTFSGEGTGYSVSGGGDVNADGYDDLIVGKPWGGGYGMTGGAYVIFGKAGGFGLVELTELAPEDGFFIQSGERATGMAVSLAGDVNGDGFDDLIVGAPYGNDVSDSSNYGGQAFVVFGKAGGFGTVDLANLGTGGFRILPDAGGDRLGGSVSAAGDVNGDGFDDIIVGARYNDDGGSSAGAAYVIFGKAGGFGTIDVTDLAPAAGFVIQDDVGDLAGSSVSAAGDVNGDGFAEVIVGSRGGDDGGANAGEAYVIFGLVPTGAVTRTGSAGGQTIVGGAFGDALNGVGGGDRLLGNGGNDLLDGGAGNDLIDGGAGADEMRGGAGNDTYFVDQAGDRVIESSATGGTDLVRSAISFTLGANVENLVLIGSGAIGGTGNGLANGLTGNAAANSLSGGAGNDLLDGGAGADTMNGGTGNDTYVVANAGDTVVESSAAGGTDTVRAAVSYTLGAHVETLVLTGAAAIGGTGNGLANGLTGNSAGNALNGGGGDDRLDGGAGADTMTGGTGNDLFIVDNAGDRAIEGSGGGTDSVQSAVGFTLGANVENLTLTGTAANGTGNGLANRLVGNEAANLLNGGGGADEMRGGAGNDVYVVDNEGDRAIESSTGGIDEIRSSVDFELGTNVEKLTLTGTAAISGRGNDLANILTGNGAANFLNGGVGADTMEGAAGDDRYVVAEAGDQVIETSGAGTDKVSSLIGYTLGDHVEHLALLGTAAINGTGNALGNTMSGNGGKNVIAGGDGGDGIRGGGSIDTLFGNAGDDRLYGGTGSDSLTGGGGKDGFYFDTAIGATNVDTIADFSPVSDTIFLDRDVFTGLAANGTLAPGAFRSGTSAADADDRIIYDSASGEIRYDPDGVGGAAAILFARVDPGTALTYADFVGYI